MSLITCPNCGKSVSDSASTCVHCGAKLKASAENFYALSPSKQWELQKEYLMKGREFPKDFNAEHTTYKRKLCIYVALLIWFAFPLIGISMAAYFVSIILLIGGVINVIIIGVLVFLLVRTIKKHKEVMEKMVKDRVDFEKWLGETHNLAIAWKWGSESQYYLEYKQIKEKEGMK